MDLPLHSKETIAFFRLFSQGKAQRVAGKTTLAWMTRAQTVERR
jgi:hypothetical protein